MIEAARRGLSDLNRYPRPEEIDQLIDLLSDYAEVDGEYISPTPGSDVVLRDVVNILSRDRDVMMESPAIPRRPRPPQGLARRLVEIRLNPPSFHLDNELLGDLPKGSLIILGNPNNPTGGEILDREGAELVLEGNLLVVDEAYHEFSGTTLADLVDGHPNIAVVRTMDKAFGLAGLRIAYAICGEEFKPILSGLRSAISKPGVYAAIEALKDPGYVRVNVSLIASERERVSRKLEELGLQTYPSRTGFLLVRTSVPGIPEELERRGVKVLDLSDRWLPGSFKVTIGTPKEDDIFLEIVEDIVDRSTSDG